MKFIYLFFICIFQTYILNASFFYVQNDLPVTPSEKATTASKERPANFNKKNSFPNNITINKKSSSGNVLDIFDTRDSSSTDKSDKPLKPNIPNATQKDESTLVERLSKSLDPNKETSPQKKPIIIKTLNLTKNSYYGFYSFDSNLNKLPDESSDESKQTKNLSEESSDEIGQQNHAYPSAAAIVEGARDILIQFQKEEIDEALRRKEKLWHCLYTTGFDLCGILFSSISLTSIGSAIGVMLKEYNNRPDIRLFPFIIASPIVLPLVITPLLILAYAKHNGISVKKIAKTFVNHTLSILKEKGPCHYTSLIGISIASAVISAPLIYLLSSTQSQEYQNSILYFAGGMSSLVFGMIAIKMCYDGVRIIHNQKREENRYWGVV